MRSIAGTGALDDPVVIDQLPFSDVRDPRILAARNTSLDAGTYYFAVDTFVSNGSEMAGEYLFTVIAE